MRRFVLRHTSVIVTERKVTEATKTLVCDAVTDKGPAGREVRCWIGQ
jgi:hypothetical protein